MLLAHRPKVSITRPIGYSIADRLRWKRLSVHSASLPSAGLALETPFAVALLFVPENETRKITWLVWGLGAQEYGWSVVTTAHFRLPLRLQYSVICQPVGCGHLCLHISKPSKPGKSFGPTHRWINSRLWSRQRTAVKTLKIHSPFLLRSPHHTAWRVGQSSRNRWQSVGREIS